MRPLTLDNIPDAIGLMNGTSADRTFAFELDLFRFLVLSRFWQFSYPYSYVAYANGEPAGVLLNSVDMTRREAYSFYWGVAERYRKTRVAWEMAREYLGRMRREGFARTTGDTSTDSPLGIYDKLGYRRAFELLEMVAERIPDCHDEHCEIRAMAGAEIAGVLPEEPDRPWTASPQFIEGAGDLLEAYGAWQHGKLAAYLTAARFTGLTTIMLVGMAPGANDALAQLISALPARGYPRPLTVSHLPAAHPTCMALERLGFRTRQRWTHISLDLAASTAR